MSLLNEENNSQRKSKRSISKPTRFREDDSSDDEPAPKKNNTNASRVDEKARKDAKYESEFNIYNIITGDEDICNSTNTNDKLDKLSAMVPIQLSNQTESAFTMDVMTNTEQKTYTVLENVTNMDRETVEKHSFSQISQMENDICSKDIIKQEPLIMPTKQTEEKIMTPNDGGRIKKFLKKSNQKIKQPSVIMTKQTENKLMTPSEGYKVKRLIDSDHSKKKIVHDEHSRTGLKNINPLSTRKNKISISNDMVQISRAQLRNYETTIGNLKNSNAKLIKERNELLNFIQNELSKDEVKKPLQISTIAISLYEQRLEEKLNDFAVNFTDTIINKINNNSSTALRSKEKTQLKNVKIEDEKVLITRPGKTEESVKINLSHRSYFDALNKVELEKIVKNVVSGYWPNSSDRIKIYLKLDSRQKDKDVRIITDEEVMDISYVSLMLFEKQMPSEKLYSDEEFLKNKNKIKAMIGNCLTEQRGNFNRTYQRSENLDGQRQTENIST
ncbi:hypothetical protein HCN44_005242 [Aphidius gifuensis]|uniref:Uncharacterized protein n=1 Tax=Aphidius gifuensis TaxID=684658 RepID=A0A835CXU1_APHGI|nr:uncharacterized protein LOC122856953 [Aphidius gifuensis]KAF7996965.1 hypothetical protein HCN44_005242 [Aphidius gifuensis]